MWTAAKLLLSGALERVLNALSVAVKWLFSAWQNLPLAIFAGSFLWLLWFSLPALREERDGWRLLHQREEQAHQVTVDFYRDAADQAERDAQANVARVKAEQDAITEEITDDYESSLADVRARAERLRLAERAGADPRRADAAGLPGSGQPAARADQAPADHRLPAARDGFDLEARLIATEQALQLDALIDWVEAQAAVRVMPEGSVRGE